MSIIEETITKFVEECFSEDHDKFIGVLRDYEAFKSVATDIIVTEEFYRVFARKVSPLRPAPTLCLVRQYEDYRIQKLASMN